MSLDPVGELRRLLRDQFIRAADTAAPQSKALSDHQATTIYNGLREIERLQKLVIEGLKVVEDFLPNVGRCVLQDYERLNLFCLRASQERAKPAELPEGENPLDAVLFALRMARRELDLYRASRTEIDRVLLAQSLSKIDAILKRYSR
jgi:hypothetical protein